MSIELITFLCFPNQHYWCSIMIILPFCSFQQFNSSLKWRRFLKETSALIVSVIDISDIFGFIFNQFTIIKCTNQVHYYLKQLNLGLLTLKSSIFAIVAMVKNSPWKKRYQCAMYYIYVIRFNEGGFSFRKL